MKKEQQYYPPKIESTYVVVEYGFLNSIEDPIVNPEQDW